MTIVKKLKDSWLNMLQIGLSIDFGKYYYGYAKSKCEITSSIVIAVCKTYPISGVH